MPITAAQIIGHRLYQAGCRFAFGMPGGEILWLMQGLEQAGIRFILVKHENNGGFMAEGAYHVTGAPGILLTTLGPGVANAVNVIANAYLDRIPLLILSGRIDVSQTAFYTHQVFDHQKVLEPITKGSFLARDPIEPIIDQALDLMLEERKGPVHIDISPEVAGLSYADYRAPAVQKRAATGPVSSPELLAARDLFARAQRPIVIAGFDCINQGAEKDLQEVIPRFNLPLLTTYKAKGLLSEDHPLCLGGAGLSPAADRYLHPFLQESDLIILVGYDPIEMRIGWRCPWGEETPVIECAAAPPRHGMHRAAYVFIGHVGVSLKAVVEGVSPQPVWSSEPPRRALREHFQRRFAETSWSAYHLFQTARQIIPKDAIITVDTGAHRILMAQIWTCYYPKTFLQSNGLSTMGVALPTAIGVKLAAPEKLVVAFIGDASFEMTLGELATLRDLGLSILLVILVDQKLALIDIKQRALDLKSLGVTFLPTDFPAIAQAMGGYGVHVQDQRSFIAEVENALSRDTFTALSCHIPPNTYDGVL